VEEQTIRVLEQIVEASGSLQSTHDFGKSDRVDRAIVVTASHRRHPAGLPRHARPPPSSRNGQVLHSRIHCMWNPDEHGFIIL
jgi:hypothetical protein